MLRVRRNKSEEKLGQREKTSVSPSHWSDLKVTRDATTCRGTHIYSQAQKLKVNTVHEEVAELLFISRSTNEHVCIRLVANTEFHPDKRQRGVSH